MKKHFVKLTVIVFAILLLGGCAFTEDEKILPPMPIEGMNFGGATGSSELPLIVANFETSLAVSISSTATGTLSLVSGTTDAGNTLSGWYGLTIDVGSSNQEYIIANCTGTACTTLTRGVSTDDGQTSVSSLKKSHRRGASVRITNHPNLTIITNILQGADGIPDKLFYDTVPTCSADEDLCPKKYMDDLAISGAPDATLTVKGISEMATQVELSGGIATGTTEAFVFAPAQWFNEFSHSVTNTDQFLPTATSTIADGWNNAANAYLDDGSFASTTQEITTNQVWVNLYYDGATGSSTPKESTLGAASTTPSTATYGSSTDTWGRDWKVSEFTDANFVVTIASSASTTEAYTTFGIVLPALADIDGIEVELKGGSEGFVGDTQYRHFVDYIKVRVYYTMTTTGKIAVVTNSDGKINQGFLNLTENYTWSGIHNYASGTLKVNGNNVKEFLPLSILAGETLGISKTVAFGDNSTSTMIQQDAGVNAIDTGKATGNNIKFAQSFTWKTDSPIYAVGVQCNVASSPTDDLVLHIVDALGGTSLTSATIPNASCTNIYDFVEVSPSVNLTKGDTYYIEFRRSGANHDTNYYTIGIWADTNKYDGGVGYSWNGSAWATPASGDSGGDMTFRVDRQLKIGYAYLTSASTTGTLFSNYVGIPIASTTIDGTASIQYDDFYDTMASLESSVFYYLQDSFGNIGSSIGSNIKSIGIAVSSTAILLK